MIAQILLLLVISVDVLEGTKNVVELCGVDMLSSKDKQENLTPTQKSDKEDELMGNDIDLSKQNSTKPKRTVSRRVQYWPYDKPVYFSFDDGQPWRIVLEAMEVIKTYTCIRFQEVEKGNQQEFHINFKQARAANSLVGMNKGIIGRSRFMQDLQIPGIVTLGTVIHEIMHALGFIHEQERPDRDEYIDIHRGNIVAGKEKNFALENDANTFGEPYDFNSIMHYGSQHFGRRENGQKLVTMSAKQEYGGPQRPIGSRGSLTTSDVIRLNRLFRCDVPRKADLEGALAKIKGRNQGGLIEESKEGDIKDGPCEMLKEMHGGSD